MAPLHVPVPWSRPRSRPGRRCRPGRGPGRTTGALAGQHLALLRTGFPELPRRISGYALDELLPE
ncbi:hypothetical protein ABZ566_38455, partial [Streptomyces hygroscopicus]|uniref:hypothetical protein n=1 Tax=Streptomyces hygroscopicus TaxID=1912 RepID=UPI0034014E49